MAQCIIANVDTEPAPLRLVLGSDAWQSLRQVLSDRLASIDAQQESATETDYPH
jgi:hypothetical protein